MFRPLPRRPPEVALPVLAHLIAATQRIGVGLLFFGLAALLTPFATLATAWLWLLAALLQGWGLGCFLYGASHVYHAWAAGKHPQGGAPEGASPQPGAPR